jgi:hypothetical protein
VRCGEDAEHPKARLSTQTVRDNNCHARAYLESKAGTYLY